MANPFPGMDPYLEGDLWTSVHTDLSVAIAMQLAPKVRPKYAVRTTRRVVLAPEDAPATAQANRFPDVGVLSSAAPSGPGTATVAAPSLVVPILFPEPIPHISVEVRDIAERRLVTCIEVLSPTNKLGTGRDEYAAKRYQVLNSPAHLLEIDLLRGGARFATAKPLPAAPYYVFLNRADSRKLVQVWPIALSSPLPEVVIPLLPGDPDVSLDLQQAFASTYATMGYDDDIDYAKPPPGPMSATDLAWIDEQLRRAGRRH